MPSNRSRLTESLSSELIAPSKTSSKAARSDEPLKPETPGPETQHPKPVNQRSAVQLKKKLNPKTLNPKTLSPVRDPKQFLIINTVHKDPVN